MKRGLMQITIGREFSTRHMAEVSRKYGVPVTWTALLSYLYGPGGHRKQLDLAAEQRKSGAMVIPQVSCRPLNFEFTFAEPFIFDVMKFMNELAVEDAKAPGTRRRAYADPAWREKLRSEVTPPLPALVGPRGHRLGAVAPGARGAAARRGRAPSSARIRSTSRSTSRSPTTCRRASAWPS